MSDNDNIPGRGSPGGDDADADAADIANAGVVLSTVATRLRHSADLADAAASRCIEASRLGDDFSAEDRSTTLHDLEAQIGRLADSVHDIRRALRDHWREMREPR